MSSFEEAVDRARVRDGVVAEGDDAWEITRDLYKAEASKRRQIHRLAYVVSSAVGHEVEGTRSWDQRAEREVVDRTVLESELRRRPNLTNFDISCISKAGWILCERVDKISDRPVILPRLSGLLLTDYGEIYSYVTGLDPLYPKSVGTDAWGNVRDDFYNAEGRIMGNVDRLLAPSADGSDVNEYDAKLKALSGTLDMEDLLAGLVARYELDTQQFEPDRWSLHMTGAL